MVGYFIMRRQEKCHIFSVAYELLQRFNKLNIVEFLIIILIDYKKSIIKNYTEAGKRTDINLLGCNQFGMSQVFSLGQRSIAWCEIC